MRGQPRHATIGNDDLVMPEVVKKNKLNNNIREIRTIGQLEKVNLDFESPRLKQAMDDLGISFEECQKK